MHTDAHIAARPNVYEMCCVCVAETVSFNLGQWLWRELAPQWHRLAPMKDLAPLIAETLTVSKGRVLKPLLISFLQTFPLFFFFF